MMPESNINWVAIYNRLFRLIDGEDSKANGMYFSGPRFIELVQEHGYFCPDYPDLMRGRDEHDLSTSRKVYFKDLFLAMKDGQKRSFVAEIVRDGQKFNPGLCNDIRRLLGEIELGPQASVPVELWNAERLNVYLKDIDTAIHDKKYEHAVTFAYTCLEGFFKAYMNANMPFDKPPKDIIDLAKNVRSELTFRYPEYPDEVLKLVTQVAHALNRTRDGFSASHFGEEAHLWLATYMRDLVNTQIRLLLHFM